MSEIGIADYDPTWPDQFDDLAAQIRRATGVTVLRIDHIGSTSVAGLAAKDILDVQVTVTDLEGPEYLSKLQEAGFRLRHDVSHDLLIGYDDDNFDLKKKYLREPQGQRRAHVHVREVGRLNQLYPLVFRDYLRADSGIREAYETVKKELAFHFPNDADAYYRIKDPYMDTIYRAAKLWAEKTNWQPDEGYA